MWLGVSQRLVWGPRGWGFFENYFFDYLEMPFFRGLLFICIFGVVVLIHWEMPSETCAAIGTLYSSRWGCINKHHTANGEI